MKKYIYFINLLFRGVLEEVYWVFKLSGCSWFAH